MGETSRNWSILLGRLRNQLRDWRGRMRGNGTMGTAADLSGVGKGLEV